MNYAELTARVQETIEDVFTADQLAQWTRFVEQKIYSTVEFPALQKHQTSALTPSNRFLTLPSDYLYSRSIAVIDADGRSHFLLHKDVSFIREAYPVVTVEGRPRHYAEFDENTYLLGPTPDQAYTVQLNYGYYPESIVTAGSTWLGENFDTALFNGVMAEAARFIKGEPDMIALYDKMYLETIGLLKMLADGKLTQDSYRMGQPKVPVT